ncbi:MAG: thioredoxin fold domain-containing protein [Ruminococcus sp.]|nr:thioredoxin fold domain-containing protein [Ruminococcus sp.]
MPARIGESEFESEVTGSPLPVLVDFYSDSCIPCKRMSPVLSQLENEYKDKIRIVKVNTNFEKNLVEKYQIQAAPTLVLFSKGEEVSRIRGAVRKEDIIELIGSVF